MYLLRGVTRLAPIRTSQPRLLIRAASSSSASEDGEGNKQNVRIGVAVAGGVFAAGMAFLAYKKSKSVTASNSPTETSVSGGNSSSVATPSTSTLSNTPIPLTSMNKDALPGLPKHVPYLLIGAGTASFAAYRAIKGNDPKAKILVIGDEPRLPYMRPPLSKELWFSEKVPQEHEGDIRFKQWNGRIRSLFFEPKAFYTPYDKLSELENGGISVVTGHKVVKIDASKQEAHLDNGDVIGYDKCLLATGGTPKVFPLLDKNELLRGKVSVFRTADDFYRLEEILKHSKKVAIIGGGFLGSELACALGPRGKKEGFEVVQMIPEGGNLAKVLPDYLSGWVTDKVKQEGVDVMTNTIIKMAMVHFDGKLGLCTRDGRQAKVDHAIVAVGISPNVDLAKESRLEVDEVYGGIKVNAELEARSNLWAAGDAASFYDVTLGRRRVEHHDHAVVSGRLAGENMTGARKPYLHQSMFWSDLGPSIGFEAIGLVDSTLETVGVFAKAGDKDTPQAASEESDEAMRSDTEAKAEEVVEKNEEVSVKMSGQELEEGEKYGKGVIFYLKDKKVVGIVMWNVFNRMGIARRIIRENKKFDDLTDLAKLFNIHGEQ